MVATIKHIAKEAGVSPQTVSRVVNNHPDVAVDTRRRIQKIIERLDYHPNTIARSLVRQQSNTLGVIISGVEQFGPSHILAGMAQEASTLNYKLLLETVSSTNYKDTDHVLNGLLAHLVDGIIWSGGEVRDDPVLWEKRLSALTIPVVFMGEEPHTSLSFVTPANQQGAYIITKHLLDQGYKHIGLIMGPARWWASDERRLGWEKGLKDAGLVSRPNQIIQGDWSAASGEVVLEQLLQQFPEMDAVFASNDQMALGVLSAARKLGKLVPQDLAVAGFDGIPESAYFSPSLTTVYYDFINMGATAVRELVAMIRTGQNGDRASIPFYLRSQPELVIRESTIREKSLA